MNGAIEVGTCEVCHRGGKQLSRTVFHYDIPGIKCTCHSPDHFITIRHCGDCTPKEPEYTRMEFKTDDLKKIVKVELDDKVYIHKTIFMPKPPEHIEINCTIKEPKMPTDIDINNHIDLGNEINELVCGHIPDQSISIQKAMEVLTKALTEDKSPGSYYYGWQSNIACAVMDNSNVDHETANKIAMKFLDQLCAK